MNLYVINLRGRFAIFKGSDTSIEEVLFRETSIDTFKTHIEDAVRANDMDSFSQRLVLKKYFRKALD